MPNLNILATGPANHNTIIMSASWTQTCAYNDSAAPVIYEGSAGNASYTRHRWTVAPAVIPTGATHVLLRVKLKAYVPNGSGVGYCQANCRLPLSGETMNHFIHVDEWGRGAGNSGEGRRVTYTTLFAPIVDGKVTIDVAHEIIGRGNVEFVVYPEGYVA